MTTLLRRAGSSSRRPLTYASPISTIRRPMHALLVSGHVQFSCDGKAGHRSIRPMAQAHSHAVVLTALFAAVGRSNPVGQGRKVVNNGRGGKMADIQGV